MNLKSSSCWYTVVYSTVDVLETPSSLNASWQGPSRANVVTPVKSPKMRSCLDKYGLAGLCQKSSYMKSKPNTQANRKEFVVKVLVNYI
jgi:hypothetical protein